MDEDPDLRAEAIPRELRHESDEVGKGVKHAVGEDPVDNFGVQLGESGEAVVEQDAELVTGHIVTATGEEDGPRDDAFLAHLVELLSKVGILRWIESHVLYVVAPMRGGLNPISEILQLLGHVVERIVEPRITLSSALRRGARPLGGQPTWV